jgi:hypothetical protein
MQEMFITVLFTKAKIWNQPKYPSPDEWIKKKYINTHWNIIYSSKDGILCSNMNEQIMLHE